MYLSHELIKCAYNELVRLDSSDGKSRKEKVSGIRYLMAASQLLKQEGTSTINLGVGSDLRQQFINAVGDVVALNESGLYTKDFVHELDSKPDYGVGSNFLTTRLANSRSQDVHYPGRPGSLLGLRQEQASILDNFGETLTRVYGIDNVKPQLCIWLLRNENLGPQIEGITIDDLLQLVVEKLSQKYTTSVVNAIAPSKTELEHFTKRVSSPYFASNKYDYTDIASLPEIFTIEDEIRRIANVLENDLPDDDKIFTTVQMLLERGAKGILFTGPPGTSKTWYALKVALKTLGGDQARLERVQFHPSYTYEDFIEGLVSTGSASGSEPMFTPKDKVFLHLCGKARHDVDNTYILIIDEFSRGDPSKIFGELLTYIEPDYREISFRLPYSEKIISIPQNIIIFATMNPYDKSVVDLDSAMERRFDVIELLPSTSILTKMLTTSGIQNNKIGKVVNFFKIANSLAPHGFGHTFFKGVSEEVDFILLWNHKLKFIFEKMFRFQDDSYCQVREAYLEILSEESRDGIT